MNETQTVSLRGTEGRIYGGDETKVHIADGQRGAFGERVADFIDAEMRAGDPEATADDPLCPGCYMIALLGAAMTLADRNGQSLVELGRAMGHAFDELALRAEVGERPDLPEEMEIAEFAIPADAWVMADGTVEGQP